jgi:hypothetical protein
MCENRSGDTDRTNHVLLILLGVAEGKSRTHERILDNAVQPRRHLRRHVVPPVPSHPLPEEILVADPQQAFDHVSTNHVHRQAALLLHAAQLEDGVHHTGLLLQLRERAPHERRDLPQVARRVPKHLLVHQEQDLLRRPLARLPILSCMLPLRAQAVAASAELIKRLLKPRLRLDAFVSGLARCRS